MTSNTQDWAARSRRKLDRARGSRRRSEAIAARPGLNPRQTDRVGAKADAFAPSDPRFAYLTRSYD